VAGETSWFAANFNRNSGLEAQSLLLGHNSTIFFEKSIFPEISSLPDYRIPGTSLILVQKTPGGRRPEWALAPLRAPPKESLANF
jgi:hypothetical protein